MLRSTKVVLSLALEFTCIYVTFWTRGLTACTPTKNAVNDRFLLTSIIINPASSYHKNEAANHHPAPGIADCIRSLPQHCISVEQRSFQSTIETTQKSAPRPIKYTCTMNHAALCTIVPCFPMSSLQRRHLKSHDLYILLSVVCNAPLTMLLQCSQSCPDLLISHVHIQPVLACSGIVSTQC